MSGKTPGSPRHPSSKHARPSEKPLAAKGMTRFYANVSPREVVATSPDLSGLKSCQFPTTILRSFCVQPRLERPYSERPHPGICVGSNLGGSQWLIPCFFSTRKVRFAGQTLLRYRFRPFSREYQNRDR